MTPPKRKSRRKPDTKEAPRTEEVADNTMSKMEAKESTEIKVETPEPNKYAP